MELYIRSEFDSTVNFTYFATPDEMKTKAYEVISDYASVPVKETREQLDMDDWVYVDRYVWKCPLDNVELNVYYDNSHSIAAMMLYDFITDEYFTYFKAD